MPYVGLALEPLEPLVLTGLLLVLQQGLLNLRAYLGQGAELGLIQETLQNAGDGSATNEIIGAIIGGAIGNKLAEDSSDAGKDVMTLAGIVLGASMANDAELANSTGQVVVSQEVCETKVKTSFVKRLSHYLVHIDYEGRDLAFTSKKRPSEDVIKVKVTVNSLY